MDGLLYWFITRHPNTKGCISILVLFSIVSLLFFCGCWGVTILDATAREIGLLPTYTPTSTPTITPIPTVTPTPTSTPLPIPTKTIESPAGILTPTGTSSPTGMSDLTNEPQLTDTPTPPLGISGVVQSLSEFEKSQFCRTYNCRFSDSWDLRSGGINNTYNIDVSPEVSVEITTLNGKPVDFGLMFFDRQELESDDFQLIYSFLNSICPGAEVDSSIRNFVEQNVEVDVSQICKANSIPFGSMRIWAGKILQQTLSVGESCSAE